MRPTADRYATDSWPTYHWQLTDIPPTYDRYSVEVCRRNIDRYSADGLSLCRPTVDHLSIDSRSTGERLALDSRSTVDRYIGRHSISLRGRRNRGRGRGAREARKNEGDWGEVDITYSKHDRIFYLDVVLYLDEILCLESIFLPWCRGVRFQFFFLGGGGTPKSLTAINTCLDDMKKIRGRNIAFVSD